MTFVQTCLSGGDGGAGGGIYSIGGSAVVTLGNTLIFAIGRDDSQGALDGLNQGYLPPNPTDNLGNTWTKFGVFANNGSAATVAIEIFYSIVTNPGTITSMNWRIHFGFGGQVSGILTEWEPQDLLPYGGYVRNDTDGNPPDFIDDTLSVDTHGLPVSLRHCFITWREYVSGITLPTGWTLAHSHIDAGISSIWHLYREDGLDDVPVTTQDDQLPGVIAVIPGQTIELPPNITQIYRWLKK